MGVGSIVYLCRGVWRYRGIDSSIVPALFYLYNLSFKRNRKTQILYIMGTAIAIYGISVVLSFIVILHADRKEFGLFICLIPGINIFAAIAALQDMGNKSNRK